jgi:hypothetical protein
MNVVPNFGCGWEFSIFGRNSWILKVLVHEMSDKIQKKLKFPSFFDGWKEVLIKLYQDEYGAKFWVWIRIFNFWSKFVSFKGVSPTNEWQNAKNIKIHEFLVLMKEGINKTLSGWIWCKIFSVDENFQFLVEIPEF